MRLMSTSFKPGECLMLVNQLEDPASREMAYCEYYYFTGQHDKAVNLTILYLNHPDPMLRLSACLIHTFANLSLNRINAAKGGLRNLKIHLNQMIADNSDRRTTAMSIFVAMAAPDTASFAGRQDSASFRLSDRTAKRHAALGLLCSCP